MPTTGSVPDISIVVPSYNPGRTILACLESLLGQQTTLAYEIIVADSSTDDTPALIARSVPSVRLVRSPTRLYPGPARNLGIAEARAPIIAFTDADCVVAPDWLERIHHAHRDHDAVGGRILNGTPGSLCGTALYLAEFVEFAGTAMRRYPSIPSCNISYKKELLARHGNFPDVSWGEEYILNTSIPGGIYFARDAVIRHVNRTGFRETVRHAYKVGQGAALSRRATGQFGYLFRYRFLIPLLFGYRFLKIGGKALANGYFAAFLLTSPILLIDLAAWTLGFARGARPGNMSRSGA